MHASSVWLLVLARDPRGAKTRLAPLLDANARADLALAMLRDVLEAASAIPFARRMVVTESDAVRAAAREAAVEALDVPLSDTNAAAAEGLRAANTAGATSALVLAADLPLLTRHDLDALLDAADEASVVVAPDRHRRGTNALLLTPPLAIAPAFGADSLRMHREHARRARIELRTVASPGVTCDVDDAADLELVRSHERIRRHTATVLRISVTA